MEKVHDGKPESITEAINNFLEKYTKRPGVILKAEPFAVPKLTGERVGTTFRCIDESAGALDGWNPKELCILSPKAYEAIAVMLNQIEEGGKWPGSTTHARVAYLQKEGSIIGEVMSYRPLTITPPLYRAWATMRLEDMEEWVRFWQLDEMYVGIPGKGAVDAWREALTEIESLKLHNQKYCGAVAVVMTLAKAAGMPPGILEAYERYLDEMVMYNCIP